MWTTGALTSLVAAYGLQGALAVPHDTHILNQQLPVDDATSRWDAYETGALGPYPQVTFKSTSFTAPRVHVTKWDTRCDHDSYTLLAPHGKDMNDNKAMLLDSRGELVWLHYEKGSVHNLQVQTYRGRRYLTFFVGDDDFWYHGSGYYKMVRRVFF